MPWLVIGGLLIVWQVVVMAFGIRPFILPSPVAIYEAFLQYRGPIMDHALYTLSSTMIGLTYFCSASINSMMLPVK